jgi:hypothetical protein
MCFEFLKVTLCYDSHSASHGPGHGHGHGQGHGHGGVTISKLNMAHKARLGFRSTADHGLCHGHE